MKESDIKRVVCKNIVKLLIACVIMSILFFIEYLQMDVTFVRIIIFAFVNATFIVTSALLLRTRNPELLRYLFSGAYEYVFEKKVSRSIIAILSLCV